VIERMPRADVAVCSVAALCATVGVVLVREGEPMVWWTLLAITSAALVMFFAPHVWRARRAESTPRFAMSARGVTRYDAGGGDIHIPWGALTDVSMLTCTVGTHDEDVYLVLRDAKGAELFVPHTDAVENGLIEALSTRLHGFQHSAYVHAMMVETDNETLLWRAPRVVSTGAPVTHSDAATLTQALALVY
jgi:hypothetical protein